VHLKLFLYEMALRDLDLLIFGVAREPDDLHAVHERRWNIERIRRGHEHHVREIVVDLEIVIVERSVLLGVQNLEQSGRRIAAEILAHLVDLIEQEQRIGTLRLLHRLDDLAGHRADVSAAMTADLSLITHTAKTHAHELAARGVGDRFAERRLAHAGWPDEAQDRPLELVGARLHREIFDDALFHLVEAVVFGIEDELSFVEVLLDLALDAPRNRKQPVEIIAHDGGFSRHRAHLLELLELGRGFVLGFLRKLGVFDFLLELGDVVAFLGVAQLLLNGLHLLIQIVLALSLFHLPLNARTDLALDLQHGDLALHERIDLLEALGDGGRLEHVLLVGDLDREVRGDRIGQLRVVLDLRNVAQDLGRDLLVELDVVLELRHRRARQGLDLRLRADRFRNALDFGLEVVGVVSVAENLGAGRAFDEYFHGAVRQLQ
jgi:hypothetical protein